VPFGVLAFASWAILSHRRICRRCRWLTGFEGKPLSYGQTPVGVVTFHIFEMRLGWASSVLRGHGVLVAERVRVPLPPVSQLRYSQLRPDSPSSLTTYSGDLTFNGASSRIHCCSPVRSSPCLWRFRWLASLGLSPLLRTAPLPVWPLGWGQALDTRLEAAFPSASLSDATACRNYALSSYHSDGGHSVYLQPHLNPCPNVLLTRVDDDNHSGMSMLAAVHRCGSLVRERWSTRCD
jgi:hypothetical protein